MEHYTKLGELGRGAFGVVLHARDERTGQEVAIKQLALSASVHNKYLAREINNHSLLRHPHIVCFREAFLTDTHLCIVMEYANGGRLLDRLRSGGAFQEPLARWFFQQLVLVVDFSHKCGVANRDIKLENLLLHQEPKAVAPLLKMCDFGYSRSNMDSCAKTKAGTPSYMAPEVMAADPGAPSGYDATLADVWSCGVVLYVMLYGKYPFDRQEDAPLEIGRKLRCMRQRMENGQFDLDPSVPVSEQCKDLLRGLLEPKPSERLTLERVMKHPWFVENLPVQAHTMNAKYLQVAPPLALARERIQELLRRATGAQASSEGSR